MPFTVLTDSDIQDILQNLSTIDVAELVQALEQTLVQFSTRGEKSFQPPRAVISRPGGQSSLFMPATTEQSIGVKIVGISPSPDPASLPRDAKPPPALKSALTLCDATGQAIGILNAAELTAFRTALGSMLLYRFRHATDNILVFGAGKQALWHIRLAVLLRGHDIRTITIVNRSSQRTQELIDVLSMDSGSGWPSHIRLEAFDKRGDSNSSLEILVAAADVIFCTTPSTQPLFPAAFLKSENARSKSRFISAIGSYRLDMQEIDPELIKAVTDPSAISSGEVWQGLVAVDSRDGCMEEAGELVKAGVTPTQLLEVGEIQQKRDMGTSWELDKWLRSGFVIYKSVGTGVMDLAIGHHLLELARSKGIGLTAQNF